MPDDLDATRRSGGLEDVIRHAEALRWARARIAAAQLDLERAIRSAHGAGAAPSELAAAASMRRRHVRAIVERDAPDRIPSPVAPPRR